MWGTNVFHSFRACFILSPCCKPQHNKTTAHTTASYINLSVSSHPPLTADSTSHIFFLSNFTCCHFLTPCIHQHYSVPSLDALASLFTLWWWTPIPHPEASPLPSDKGQSTQHQLNLTRFSDSLSPILPAFGFSDLWRSEKDLLGSSLNRGNGLWSAYWSPCCVCTLTLWAHITQAAFQAKRYKAVQKLSTAHTHSHSRLDAANNSQHFGHSNLLV